MHVRQVHLYKSLTVRESVGRGSARPGSDSAPSGGAQASRDSHAALTSGPDTLSASPCSTTSQPRDLFETWMILGGALPSPCPLPRCLQVNHGLGFRIYTAWAETKAFSCSHTSSLPARAEFCDLGSLDTAIVNKRLQNDEVRRAQRAAGQRTTPHPLRSRSVVGVERWTVLAVKVCQLKSAHGCDVRRRCTPSTRVPY